MKRILLVLLFFVWALNVYAQTPVNKVTISDFEERLALVYWSKNYTSYAEQLELFLAMDKTYATRNYYRMGIAYIHIGQIQKAEAAFIKGTEADAYFPYNYAGLALLKQNAAEKVNLYKKALSLSKKYDPNFYSDKRPEKKELSILLPKSNAWINHNIGLIYFEKKQYDSARYFFHKASSERPEDIEHLIALAIGNYNYYSGETKKSKKNLKQADQLDKKDFRVAALKSFFEYKEADYAQASTYIQETKSNESNNVIVMLLKELSSNKISPNKEFEKNINTILTKDSTYNKLLSIPSKSTEEKEKLLLKEIEDRLFKLEEYYNPHIYPSGGYSYLSYDGKKNTSEKLYIKK